MPEAAVQLDQQVVQANLRVEPTDLFQRLAPNHQRGRRRLPLPHRAACADEGADDRARLAANVAAHCSTLRRSLGPVYEHWAPRTAVRSVVRLAGGVGELHDTIDLLIGSTRDDVASTALLDVTTAPLGPPNERTMRFHALVHTLRSTRTPLRVGTLSSATGEFWIRDVDAPALNVAVDELLQVFAALWVRP